jgi:amino acid adenylation domain-containing protein
MLSLALHGAAEADRSTSAAGSSLCIHQLFERQVARTPDAVAVLSGTRQLTYGQLNERANRLAHYLRRRGAGPDALIGVCLKRSPEMLAALLGVWKSGAAYVPLDPNYPPERLAFMARDAGLKLFLADRECAQLLGDVAEAVCLDSDWSTIERERAEDPRPASGPANLAYVMYTSGSTGQPKGAMILHGGLANYVRWAADAYDFRPGGLVPVHSSISFDLTVTSLYPPLLVGGQVDLLPESPGAQGLVDALLHGKRYNVVKITPAHLELLVQQLTPAEMATATGAFVIGGENLRYEILRPWRRHAPATRLFNEYGPTETVVGCCVHEVQAEDGDNGSVPIGRPIADTRLHVLDADLKPVPPGISGELYIGGAGVARGYLNRPQISAERFLPDPFSAGGRLYRTGDLARCEADGTLEFLGRTDSQVKLHGYRIELGEIEASLMAHPGLRSCAVCLREDEAGNRQLTAYAVPRPDAFPATGELQRFLKQRLPDYMVPAQWVFLDALPLTHNGKVDRQALPAPAVAQTAPGKIVAEPRNAVEEKLLGIFREALGRADFGIFDSFFDLGGHSLMAARLVARVQDATSTRMALWNLFETPTVAGLAEVIERLSLLTGTTRSQSDLREREEIRL